MSKSTVYTQATKTPAEVARENFAKYSTPGQVAQHCDTLTGEIPMAVTNMTAAEMVEAELSLMKGLGL